MDRMKRHLLRPQTAAPKIKRLSVGDRLQHREIVLTKSINALSALAEKLPEDVEASPQVARSVVAQENRWRSMENEFGMLDSTGVAEELGNSATNRNKASQLVKEGKLLGVKRGNKTLFPKFEFDLAAGKVRPVISDVVQIAGDRWSGESLLQWFCAPNGYLDGRRPVDVIDDQETLISTARKSLAEEW